MKNDKSDHLTKSLTNAHRSFTLYCASVGFRQTDGPMARNQGAEQSQGNL